MKKRTVDIFLSLLALTLLSPFFIAISLWIKWDSAGPVFFFQARVGRYLRPFSIIKFRTMKVGSETQGSLTIGEDPRITHSGHFLRKSKLDELPQLLNVLMGDMSLVGPRPELAKYVDHVPPKAKQVLFAVRPGITDLASLKFYDEPSILAQYADPEIGYLQEILPHKLAIRMQQVETASFWSDQKILLVTILKWLSF